MKNSIKLLVAAFIFIFNFSAQAQTKSLKLENSLLWEVSGNGLSKPSYLYGTIHMICNSDYFLTENTTKALAKAEKLVLEINLADPAQLADMQQTAMGKEPLSKKLDPQQLSKLDAYLKKTTGMSAQQVDGFNLITVMSLAAMKSFGCPDIKYYEMEFIETAKTRQLPIAGFETVKSQVEVFEKSYNDAQLIDMIVDANPDDTANLVSHYIKGDISKIYLDSTNEKVMPSNAKKHILDDRNTDWVKQFPELSKNTTVFYAFGAAHLDGELGVINLLRKAGYSVKPVMN
jgi:uncharacterized protein YbaP (TraB family)